jgi:hypothetical protein
MHEHKVTTSDFREMLSPAASMFESFAAHVLLLCLQDVDSLAAKRENTEH